MTVYIRREILSSLAVDLNKQLVAKNSATSMAGMRKVISPAHPMAY
jgi:hypothetical protein